METTSMEEKEKIPKHLKRVLLLTLWLFIAIILIKIFKIEYLGFPYDKIPIYLKWLTVIKLILIYIFFLFGKYGWSKPDRSGNLDERAQLFILLYEGLARILFIVLAILVLRVPYNVLIYYTLPDFVEYRMIPWVLVWLFIFYLSLRRDKFISTIKELAKDPVVKEYLANFVANTIFYIRNKWQHSTLFSKLIFLGAVIGVIIILYNSLTK